MTTVNHRTVEAVVTRVVGEVDVTQIGDARTRYANARVTADLHHETGESVVFVVGIRQAPPLGSTVTINLEWETP